MLFTCVKLNDMKYFINKKKCELSLLGIQQIYDFVELSNISISNYTLYNKK